MLHIVCRLLFLIHDYYFLFSTSMVVLFTDRKMNFWKIFPRKEALTCNGTFCAQQSGWKFEDLWQKSGFVNLSLWQNTFSGFSRRSFRWQVTISPLLAFNHKNRKRSSRIMKKGRKKERRKRKGEKKQNGGKSENHLIFICVSLSLYKIRFSFPLIHYMTMYRFDEISVTK